MKDCPARDKWQRRLITHFVVFSKSDADKLLATFVGMEAGRVKVLRDAFDPLEAPAGS